MSKIDYKNPIMMDWEDFYTNRLDEWAAVALERAIEKNCRVQFYFNNVLMNVTPTMQVSDIMNNYHRKIFNNYSPEQEAASMKAQTTARLSAMKWERKRNETLAKIANEQFRINWPAIYADDKSKNIDPYGVAIFRYAENWGKLMQIEMRAGKKLTKNLIEQTSKDADVEGVTGFMFSCARNILVSHWVRGAKFGEILHYDIEQIRLARWQNCIQNARLARTK